MGDQKPYFPIFFNLECLAFICFFVISGFVMVAVTRGRFQNHKQALTFIYHRASRIYPTYWVNTILVFIVFLVQPSWVNSSQGGQVDVIASVLVLACFVLLASLYGYDHYRNITEHVEPAGWWRILIFGVPALLLVFCFTKAEIKGYVIHSSLVKIGNASYSIYLSHVLTLSVIGRIWSMFLVDAVYDNLIMIPVLFMMVILIGFTSYHMVEKPLLEFSRKIA